MIRSTFFVALSLWLVASLAPAADPLPRATPESQGVSSAQIRAFVEAADKEIDTLHSFMLVRHGRVVAEGWWKPEAAERQHVLWSLSKSFTSTAVGFAVAEGKFSVDDPVLKFFPDDAPANPSDKLKQMRVRDLLTMSTGHDVEPRLALDSDWVKTFLAHPVPHKPGAHFQYNTPATYMLSAIVQKTTGETVLDYLRPRLFEPLGIEDPKWGTSPQGITLGGYGLFIKTEDIAKFGQLYLQKGMWNGKRILPAEWIDQATAKQVSNGSDPKRDWDQGYGYQFWRCRHDAYRGDGKDGQFCVVLPKLDAVIAITAHTGDMQKELNVVWDHLLSAFHDEPLPENPDEVAKLKETFARLEARHEAPPPVVPGIGSNGSKTLEAETLASALLKKEMKYAVYLPPGYETSRRDYPVLYLLHGFSDDQTAWLTKGNMREIVDRAIASGQCDPLVIVMPDAEKTYYLNNQHGDYPFADYFVQELIPHVESKYRIKREKKHRAIAGLSMGGFGSVLYSLQHPELFQSCYAMSGAFRSDEQTEAIPHDEFKVRYETALGPIKPGDPRITEYWKAHDPIRLVAKLPDDRKKAVRFAIDCGDDDKLTIGNALLHVAMQTAGVPHEYRVRDGGHVWEYWRASLPDALVFVTKGWR